MVIAPISSNLSNLNITLLVAFEKDSFNICLGIYLEQLTWKTARNYFRASGMVDLALLSARGMASPAEGDGDAGY